MEVRAHGSLIDVLEVGVLLLGPSGIGKSECALELISRGHHLVADDVVRIRRDEPADGTSRLVGSAPEVVRHYMEIRGIGLLYVPELFGAESVRDEGVVDLACRLEEWTERGEYDRVGLDRPTVELAGVRIPMLILPARPAGSMATLVEVAARDHARRRGGEAAAVRLDRGLFAQRGGPPSEGGAK